MLLFQIDMKIMYYELIRMLIDYERKNHPQTYDATKTVGKIEGYQELTNKLQRYILIWFLSVKIFLIIVLSGIWIKGS